MSGSSPPPPTFTISGTISPAAAGLAVKLGGATGATTTADAAGKYEFADLPDGNYTVTPSGASLSFSPATRQVIVAGANMSSVDFTATPSSPPPPPTFTISGTISPASAGSTVTLGGATSATAIADAAGNYRFAGLLDGGYTVTPSGPSLSFSPAGQPISVAGANVSGVNFTATPSSSPPPPPPPTFTISGTISPAAAGLAVKLGGATGATTTADAAGKYEFADLPDGNYTVTPSGPSLSFSPTTRQVVVAGANASSVDFTATPSSPPPPPTFTISGTISPASAGSTVTLGGATSGTAIADAAGNYQFPGLLDGGYTVTPSGPSLSFSPTTRQVVVAGANASSVDFTASPSSPPPPPPTFTISGTISPASAGLAVRLGGATGATTTADTAGKYQFAGLPDGNYTVTPSGPSLSFSPPSQQIIVAGANMGNVNFTATLPSPPPPPTFTISGTISPALAGAGSTVTLSGAASATAIADPAGNYKFPGLLDGGYTVTPSGASLSFSPANQPVNVAGANVSGVNFIATRVIFFDDFAGTSLGPAWKVIERRGPASQAENACNTAGAVGVSGGILTITTSATPATCGDATPLPPTQLPYTTGDIQWTSLNFTYGTVEVRAKFPPQNTGTWPAIWLLGANCQAANPLNGSEDLAFNGCPEQGNPAYQEIDMVECDVRGWCHIVVAQGSGGWSSMCTFKVDANFHVFTLTWNASIVSIAVDGNPTGCSYPNTSLDGPMFLIMQTQTTTSSGVAGLPNNANLPATFQIDYVKVTQP